MRSKTKLTVTSNRTIDGIIRLLKMEGPSAATELASRLQISDTAVRQHLYRLRDQDLVQNVEEKRSMGRPVKLWSLTEEANQRFPDSHAKLACDLLDSIESVHGNDGLNQIVCRCTQDQITQYKSKIRLSDSLKLRLNSLVEIRNQEGYMAEVEKGDDGSYIFVENHCPICSVVQIRNEFCDAELSVFQAILGKDVTVEREEYVFDGDRRCTFRIRKRII